MNKWRQFDPSAGKLFVSHFYSFKTGIAKAISSFKCLLENKLSYLMN